MVLPPGCPAGREPEATRLSVKEPAREDAAEQRERTEVVPEVLWSITDSSRTSREVRKVPTGVGHERLNINPESTIVRCAADLEMKMSRCVVSPFL